MGGCTEEVLRWFNYSCTSIHPGCKNNQTALHCHFTCALSTPARQWKARKQTDIYRLVCCLQCANVVLQVKNSVNEATDSRTITLCQWTYFRFTAQLRTYLVWWAVTWETLKTTYLSKLKGGYVHGQGWVFAWDNTMCNRIIRAVDSLSQSKIVTWFMGPRNRFLCPNINA